MSFSELQTEKSDCIKIIRNNVSTPDILDQLAEEAAELSHAALKLARIKRGTNPTPVTEEEAVTSLVEELSDLWIITQHVLNIDPDETIVHRKLVRWKERIEEKNSRLKQGLQ